MRAWSSHPLAGFVVVIGAASLFGMLGPLSRFAYDAGMEPLSFVAWRALIGALAVGAFVAWQVRRGHERLVSPRSLTTRARILLGVAGFTGFALNLAMFIAFDRITVALALLGFYTYPALVAIAAVALGRERLDRSKGIALALAMAGMVAVVAGQLDPAGGIRIDALGFGLALGAALSQAIFVSISRDGYSAVPTGQAMTFILVTTVALCGIVALATGGAAALARPLADPGLLPLVLFTGLFAAALPSFAFLSGIRWIGGMRAGILMLFEPVVGVALAAWLLSEPLQPIQAVGGAAILGAAIILQRSTRSTRSVSPADEPAGSAPDRSSRVDDDPLSLRVPGGP
jgi:drug/metabolite transporter (DMT)-like permease